MDLIVRVEDLTQIEVLEAKVAPGVTFPSQPSAPHTNTIIWDESL